MDNDVHNISLILLFVSYLVLYLSTISNVKCREMFSAGMESNRKFTGETPTTLYGDVTDICCLSKHDHLVPKLCRFYLVQFGTWIIPITRGRFAIVLEATADARITTLESTMTTLPSPIINNSSCLLPPAWRDLYWSINLPTEHANDVIKLILARTWLLVLPEVHAPWCRKG
jgi:hypothetical protein